MPDPKDTPDVATKATSRKRTATRGTAGTSARHLTPAPDVQSPAWLIEPAGEPAHVVIQPDRPTSAGTITKLIGAQILDQRKQLVFHGIEAVETLTIPTRYATAIICDFDNVPILGKDGRAQRYVVRLPKPKPKGGWTPPAVIWEGEINVSATYIAFEITSGRTLRPLEWSRYVSIESVNKNGVSRKADIPMMDFRQQQSKAAYIDRLAFVASGCISDIVNFIRIRLNEMGDDGISIHGQGPVTLEDGTRAFCAKSVVFDESGNVRDDIRVDLSGIPERYRYYDVTPPAELDQERVTSGCHDLISAYDELPTMREVPAAFLGSLFTAPIVAVEPQFFVALFLSGTKGSGKTYMSLRYDAIQSRTLRGRLQSIAPVLNIGDRTGTTKGSKYRAEAFAGFAITADDVIKDGDTQFQINDSREYVSNMTRSFESGGAALGKVDRTRNRVVSGESGSLHSNVKWTSEKPIPGASTLERLIMLPHLTASWGDGLFDTELSERLTTPESIENQHHAWSALAYWMFTRMSTVMPTLYDRALSITKQWDVSARSASRYAAVLAGHYAFAEFCAERGIDVSGQIERATDALRECAQRQTAASMPLADLFRLRLRQMLTDGRVAFLGRPTLGPDGAEEQPYSDPRILEKVGELEDGEIEFRRVLPAGVNLSDLGVAIVKGAAVPSMNARLAGFVRPPLNNPGRNTNPLKKKWAILITRSDQRWANLCHALTEYSRTRDGQQFRPEDVERSLAQEQVGFRVKSRYHTAEDLNVVKKYRNTQWLMEIDCSWLFASTEETES